MSHRIIADKVFWLCTANSSGTLEQNQALLYIAPKGLGMTHPGTHFGLSPEQAFEARYRGQISNMSTDFHGTLIVYECTEKNIIHDDEIRAKCHNESLNRNITFDAYNKINNPAPPGINNEQLINFNIATDLNTLLEIIKTYFGIGPIKNTLPPWVPRDAGTPYGQDLMVIEILEKFHHHKKVAFNGHTGLAKTMVAAAVVHQLYPSGAFILATTPVSDTLNDIISNFTEWHYPNDSIAARSRKTVVYTEADLSSRSVAVMRTEADSGDIVVLAITVQDARYREDSSKTKFNVRTKYEDLTKIVIDLWLRDEKHKEYDGDVTGKIFENLLADRVLDLSASINKIRDEYSFDAIVDRGLFWALEYQALRRTPEVIIEALDGAVMKSLSIADQSRYDIEDGWLPSKMTEMRNNILLSTTAIDAIFSDEYINTDDKEDNPLSIINDPDLPEISKKVSLHVFPEGVNGRSAGEYITRLAADRNCNPKWNLGKAVFVTPWTWTAWSNPAAGLYTIAQVVEHLASKFEHVIILTHRVWTVGSNIPPIGHVVLWDKMCDPYSLEQLFPGRPFRIYTDKYGNVKTHIKMYILHPGTRVQENMCVIAKQTAGVRKDKVHPTVLLRNINFKKYTVGIGVHALSVNEVYERFNQRIKERLNHNVPVDAINCAINGTPQQTDLSALDLENAILGGSSVDLTAPNGGKKQVTQLGKNTPKVSSQNKNIAKSINAVMIEIPAFAVLEKITDIESALSHKQIRAMFSNEKIDILIKAVKENISLRSLLQDKLTECHQALGLLGFEEVHDYIFKNTKMKKSVGLVFISMKSAESFASKEIEHLNISNKYNGTLAVVNALSGSVPFHLQKQLPNATIVCVEKHSYYVDHLTSIGYDIISWENLKMDDRKNSIKYWFLNPPYQKDASGENDDSNKQGSFWYPFIELALTTSASTDDAKYFVVSPKSIFGAGGFGSNAFKVSKILNHAKFKHIFPDVTTHFPGIGIAIAGYVLDKEKTDSLVSVDGYDESITIDGAKPVPFEVSPTASKVLDRCFMIPAKIPFRENIAATDTDAVIKVNGGRYKVWGKTFVGFNKDTEHNQQGAIINADDIAGYQSGKDSILWEYIFKILGGEKGNSTTVIMKHMPIMEDMTRSYSNKEWFDVFNIDDAMQQDILKFLREYK